MATSDHIKRHEEESVFFPDVGESGRLEDSKQTFCRLERHTGKLDKMLKKAPKLKFIVKTKAKSNINVRATSEAMVSGYFSPV